MTAPIPVIAPKISVKNLCEPAISYSFKICSVVDLSAEAKCVLFSIISPITALFQGIISLIF
jgi:hypothetical protein